MSRSRSLALVLSALVGVWALAAVPRPAREQALPAPRASAAPEAELATRVPLPAAPAPRAAELLLTLHELELLGPDARALVLDGQSDSPVTLDVLRCEGQPLPIAGRALPSGRYTHARCVLSLTAFDAAGALVPCRAPELGEASFAAVESEVEIGDPDGLWIEGGEALPALFLNIEVARSAGADGHSLLADPRLSLCSSVPQRLIGRIERIDAQAGLFELACEDGTRHWIEPLDSTELVDGRGAVAAHGAAEVLRGLERGQSLVSEGVWGRAALESARQVPLLHHPQRLRLATATAATAVIAGQQL